MNLTFKNTLASSLGVLIIYALFFKYLDQSIALWAKNTVPPLVYQISVYLSVLGGNPFWMIVSIGGLAIFGYCYAKQKVSDLSLKILYFCSSIAIAQVIGSCLKTILGRARPRLFFDHQLYGFYFFSALRDFHSTPSGHTLNIFAIATIASILYRRFASLFLIIAVVEGLSRILITQHYVSDVILGAYIGILAGFIVKQFLVSKFDNRTVVN